MGNVSNIDDANINFVLLGAGKPLKGGQHTVLRGVSDSGQVLDWVMQAVSFLMPSVTFVGGYQVDEIIQRYPYFHYVINPQWDKTGAVASFLETSPRVNSNYLVSYSDILYRESVIRQMMEPKAEIVVAVDSEWRQRFEGRTEEDINRCEKANIHGSKITRLGSDIDSDIADAEFVGLVWLKPNVISFIVKEMPLLKERFREAKLSRLVEYLRTRGFEVEAVDVEGDWAELNESQDIAHFVLGTKAQTLARLQGLVRKSRIEDQISFSVAEWKASSQIVVERIKEKFVNSSLVVRSSALSEDSFTSANAGAYTSVLNVQSQNNSELSSSIDSVIASYGDSDPVNQVLVQPMVSEVVASGVAFTRTLDHGSPYYVINYDDVSKSTESITSGRSLEHKTLVIHKGVEPDENSIPDVVRGLLPALKEIEHLLNFDSLDIEFAISAERLVHILQVRPIAVDHGEKTAENDDDLEVFLRSAELQFEKHQHHSPFVVGRRTFFGVMPDWNPAEIIGINPGMLATTLYRYLILDEIWAKQRFEYGYRDVRPQPLLNIFCGRPYIDVRASFNSFIPAELDDGLACRLVDFYLDWLESSPHLHDKVEFEVVPTCMDLDFDRWARRLNSEGGFSASEVESLSRALLTITTRALYRNDTDLKSIETLEARYFDISLSGMKPLEMAIALLDDAKEYGTLAFSHLARSAFIAVTLLRSAVRVGVIKQEAMDGFLNSIRTVSHHFTDDAFAVSKGNLDWEEFVRKYGHLRPGTYDITSKCYADEPDRFLRPVVAHSARIESNNSGLESWVSHRSRFEAACGKAGLPEDIDLIERFMRDSIEGREYAKFAFTRNISHALNCLIEF